MTHRSCAAALFTCMLLTYGCGSRPESAATTSSAPDAATARAPVAPAAKRISDVCSVISLAEVTEGLGVAIERADKKPDGCEWYANPAALQQKGADTVRGTFAKLSKQEPASAEEGARSMESMLKGLTGAVAPNKPVFGVIVNWEDGDQAEAMFKTTMAVNGRGLPGGSLEPIEGLGDRAFMGPMGAFFFARKGPMFINFGYGIGTREQAIALARRFVSRIG